MSLVKEFLEEGERLLQQGRLMQASEKFWGAVAQMVKAVAAKEGMELETHRDLRKFMNHLAKVRGEIKLAKLFAEANYLHRNFHEGELLQEMIKAYVTSAKELISMLWSYLA